MNLKQKHSWCSNWFVYNTCYICLYIFNYKAYGKRRIILIKIANVNRNITLIY